MMGIADYIKNHLSAVPPESCLPCDFKVGDLVTFTNNAGVVFHNHTVIGFSEDSDVFYMGRFIHDKPPNEDGAYWFPHKIRELKKQAGWIDCPGRGTKEQQQGSV